MDMDEIVEHTLCGPANNDMHAYVDEGICDSDLVEYLAILGELKEYTCVGTQPHHDDDSLMEYEASIILKLMTCVTKTSDGDWYALGGVEFQLVYNPRYEDDVMEVLNFECHMLEFQLEYGLWYGDEHEGRSIPALISWFLPHTLLIDYCPTLLFMAFSAYTLRTTTVLMIWRDLNHFLSVGNWHDDEILSSYVIGGRCCTIIGMIFRLLGVFLIYISSL